MYTNDLTDRQTDIPMLRPLTVLTVLARGVVVYSDRKSSSPMPSSISYNTGAGLKK